MDRKLLVIDVGSSELKAVLFDGAGAVAGTAASPIPTDSRSDGTSEQNPDHWWAALGAALGALPNRRAIAAIALTGSMQNVIALDPDGRALAPAILYSDRRLSDTEMADAGARLPADYGGRTGNRLDPAHCILKLMLPERFMPGLDRGRPHRLLFGAKDAAIFRLTGRAVIDPTTASTTGLMNIRTGAWDAELTRIAGAGAGVLPDILPADAVVGPLLPDPAAALDLEPGIPVFNGAGDAAAASWGALAEEPGVAYAHLGTSGWAAATVAMDPADLPRDIYTLADPVDPGRVIVISPFLAAGAALNWLAETTGETVETLLDKADGEDETPPKALFLPYLSGERGPFADRLVRGAFLGLDRGAGSGALCHAVCEGIAFAVRNNLEAAGLGSSTLTLIGGAARHRVQRQLLADALDCTIRIPDNSQEMTAYGVLRMVAKAAGFEGAGADGGGAAATYPPRAQRRERADRRYAAFLEATAFARAQAENLQ